MYQVKRVKKNSISLGFIMNINHVEIEPSFNVIGIAIRTTNKAAIDDGTIQKLWQQFLTESIPSKIPNKVDGAIIALYYGFENDKSGEYNLLLGARVSSIDEIPAGMVAQNVPAQKRAIFLSGSGSVGQVCFELWKKIWVLEGQSELDRAYIADYELYDERSQDPQNGQVAIHIGTK